MEPHKRFLRGYTFIDLFAGIGGFRLALAALGGKCVFSSDIDPHAQFVYHNNFGEQPHGDITKIAAKEIPAHDILCAGFPCQPFSIAGTMGGFGDTRGTLFHEIIRIADHHRPRMIFLENVRNLQAHAGGRTLKTIIKSLEGIGYDVDWKVLNAGHYGIPQKRERIYILGFDRNHPFNYEWPEPLKTKTKVRDILLPGSDPTTKAMHIDRKKYPIKLNAGKVVKAGTPKPVRIGATGLGRQGERVYHPNGHAVTISASGGGVGAKTGMYLVDRVVRRLTPRECARLNGFPEEFQPHHRTAEALKQFGNSVVIDVIQHVMLQAQGLFK
ncbi:DNA cytosine methyltransferase [bacterium]|nr:DNA cytosine methyltransferase [bacterium]